MKNNWGAQQSSTAGHAGHTITAATQLHPVPHPLDLLPLAGGVVICSAGALQEAGGTPRASVQCGLGANWVCGRLQVCAAHVMLVGEHSWNRRGRSLVTLGGSCAVAGCSASCTWGRERLARSLLAALQPSSARLLLPGRSGLCRPLLSFWGCLNCCCIVAAISSPPKQWMTSFPHDTTRCVVVVQ